MIGRTSAGDDRGSVVLLTLIVGCLLTALATSLATLASTERVISSNYQRGQQTIYAADALVEFAIGELINRGDWTPVVSGAERSAFYDGTLTPTTGWRTTVDLARLTATLQQHTDTSYSGVDTPRWQLFASGPLDRLAGSNRPALAYLAAWVADDGADGDGDPAADANGLVMLRVAAFSVGGLRRSFQLVLKRPAGDSSVTSPESGGEAGSEAPQAALARFLPYSESPSASAGGVTVLSWREVH
jgi:hypothetical protein